MCIMMLDRDYLCTGATLIAYKTVVCQRGLAYRILVPNRTTTRCSSQEELELKLQVKREAGYEVQRTGVRSFSSYLWLAVWTRLQVPDRFAVGVSFPCLSVPSNF